MHFLKICLICLTASAFFVSCKSEGPRSPEEAFDALKNAYIKSDAGAVEKLISERSKGKIRIIINMISSMDNNQLEAIGSKFNTEPGRLKNLSIKDFIFIQLKAGEQQGNDAVREALKYKITGIDNKDGKAVVRAGNGMELLFTEENGYWKFDMEELSSVN